MNSDTYLFEQITPDPGAIEDNAIRAVQEHLPDYDPDRDPLGRLLIRGLAQGQASLVDWASDLLATIFAHVAETAGVVRTMPAPATGTVTITTDGNDTYVVPSGAVMVGRMPDGTSVPLHLTADAEIPQGTTSLSGVPVEAPTDGLLTAIGTPQALQPDQAYQWLDGVTLDALTSPGADGEDNQTYLDRASRRMRNQGEILVLPDNIQRFVADFPGVGRALVLDLIDATDPNDPQFPVDRHVTIVSTGLDGSPPSNTLLSELGAALHERRETNFRFHLVPPTYLPVSIELTVAAWPDSLDDTAQRVEDAIRNWLHPARFAARSGHGMDDGTWEPTSTIRIGEIVSVADLVEGVDYVDPTLVEIDGSNEDYVLSAPIAALPDPESLTVSVNVVERTP